MNRLRELEREYFASGDIELLPSIHRLRDRYNVVPTNPISTDYFLAIMRGKTEVEVDKEYIKILSPFDGFLIENSDTSMTNVLGPYQESLGRTPLNFDLFRLEPGYDPLTPGEFDEKLREIAHFIKRFGWVTLIREPSYDTEFPPVDFDEQYSEAIIFPITALQPNGGFEHRMGQVVANEVRWGETGSKIKEMLFLVKRDRDYITQSCVYRDDLERLTCASGIYDMMTREEGYINYLQRLMHIGWMHGTWDFELIFE